MKKIVVINGLIAALIIAGVSAAFLWTINPEDMNSHAEWLGYLVMVVGLAFIFVAVKQYRDQQGGVITFTQGFQVGLLVTLIAALIYVVSWEFYYQSLGSGFIASYQESYLSQMRADGATEAELQQTAEEMTEFAALYAQFYFRAMITLLEILPVGLLITLLAAWLLKTKNSVQR